jgi:O-methyltransferase
MISSLKRKLTNRIVLDPEESLLRRVMPYTMVDTYRLKNLIRLGNYVNSQNIEGDFVECGVYKGGSAAILSKHLSKTRKLWLYDSFEGMPETTEKDGKSAQDFVGDCVGSVEEVREVMQLVSTSKEQYILKKGWFSETFCEELPKQIAILHCDADWYDSVTLVLETFYKLIPDGGCVILDDFGYWEGCREAFYDFCFKHNEKPLLERVGDSQLFWIKGKTSSRDF